MNEHLAEAIVVFFLGAIVLAPVAAASARFAMKPLITLFGRRAVADEVQGQVAEQGRRIDMLEGELAAMHESLRSLEAEAEFERRLTAGDAGPGPRAGSAS